MFSGATKMGALPEIGKKDDRSNSNLPMIANSIHVFNSLFYSSRNIIYCKKVQLSTLSKYHVILDTRGIVSFSISQPKDGTDIRSHL